MFYRVFKYSVYLLLFLNIGLFFLEEWQANQHTLNGTFSTESLIESYAQTIDTLSWVILLFLFELETFVLDDRIIKGWTKWSLHGVRALCYIFIVYSFSGYLAKTLQLYQSEPTTLGSICSVELNTYSFMLDLDEYETILPGNCRELESARADSQLHILGRNRNIITDSTTLGNTRKLAWVDTINSATWIIVVLLLEFDVLFQLAHSRRRHVFELLTRAGKTSCYSILLAAAIYWGMYGTLLDFWDAFLWLTAFIFIEMNVFKWQHEAVPGGKPAVNGI